MSDRIAEKYTHGFSAIGSPLVTANELGEVLSISRQRGDLIHTIEGFIITGGDEIIAPEYSLFGPDEGSESLSWSDQIALAENYVEALLVEARNHVLPVAFKVWLASSAGQLPSS